MIYNITPTCGHGYQREMSGWKIGIDDLVKRLEKLPCQDCPQPLPDNVVAFKKVGK